MLAARDTNALPTSRVRTGTQRSRYPWNQAAVVFTSARDGRSGAAPIPQRLSSRCVRVRGSRGAQDYEATGTPRGPWCWPAACKTSIPGSSPGGASTLFRPVDRPTVIVS